MIRDDKDQESERDETDDDNDARHRGSCIHDSKSVSYLKCDFTT